MHMEKSGEKKKIFNWPKMTTLTFQMEKNV